MAETAQVFPFDFFSHLHITKITRRLEVCVFVFLGVFF